MKGNGRFQRPVDIVTRVLDTFWIKENHYVMQKERLFELLFHKIVIMARLSVPRKKHRNTPVGLKVARGGCHYVSTTTSNSSSVDSHRRCCWRPRQWLQRAEKTTSRTNSFRGITAGRNRMIVVVLAWEIPWKTPRMVWGWVLPSWASTKSNFWKSVACL
jgi:hypothetical protein